MCGGVKIALNALLHENMKKILCVDDCEDKQLLIQSLLSHEDVELTMATSGSEALDHVYEEKYDLILLDIMMPHIDGLHVANILKKRSFTNSIPIIFVTAASQDDERISEGELLKNAEIIFCPDQFKELASRVNEALAGNQSLKN